ncbi:MAG: hypothetical protein JWQ83_2248 [Lacunisphaera sp.]|jgi:soluble cytochrome b562|nr:hypothetical protein [Lacunisphaera sp.]
MKNRLLFLVLAFTLTFPATALRAAEPPPAGATSAPQDDETELGRTMSKLNGAWRKLRKQAADATANAKSLEFVATIKAAAEKALTLEPAKAEDVPAAERAKFIADYRAQMKDFIAQIDKLGEAFKANDNAAAQAIIQKMGAMQKEGHKEFKRPEH